MDMETLADPLIFLPILLYYPFLHLLPLRGDSFTVSTDVSFCIQVPFGSLMVQEHSNNNPKRNGYERLVFKPYSQWCHAGLWSRWHKTTSTPPWPPNHSTSFLHCELFDATSLSTSDYCFQAPNSCRDLSRGWKNQLNLGLVPDVANRGSASSKWISLYSAGPSPQGHRPLGHGSRINALTFIF